jgi:hypothetical protein
MLEKMIGDRRCVLTLEFFQDKFTELGFIQTTEAPINTSLFSVALHECATSPHRMIIFTPKLGHTCLTVSSSKSAFPVHTLALTELHACDNCRHRLSPHDF